MERDRNFREGLNEGLRLALFRWKGNPDSQRATDMMKAIIYQASEFGYGIKFAVTDEIRNSSEAWGRAISQTDIQKFSKYEGGQFIFRFGAKKSKNPEYTLTAKILYGQPLLILHGKHEGMIGMFRPHEIDYITTL